jgi:hypothetical protein
LKDLQFKDLQFKDLQFKDLQLKDLQLKDPPAQPVELFSCRARQIARCAAVTGLPELDCASSERSRTGATGSWK